MLSLVATPRSCTVAFYEPDGSGRFAVDVNAESTYEAAVRALKLFREEPWSAEAAWATGYLEVSVRAPEIRYKILLADLEEWLARPGGSPREMVLRQELRQLLE